MGTGQNGRMMYGCLSVPRALCSVSPRATCAPNFDDADDGLSTVGAHIDRYSGSASSIINGSRLHLHCDVQLHEIGGGNPAS